MTCRIIFQRNCICFKPVSLGTFNSPESVGWMAGNTDSQPESKKENLSAESWREHGLRQEHKTGHSILQSVTTPAPCPSQNGLPRQEDTDFHPYFCAYISTWGFVAGSPPCVAKKTIFREAPPPRGAGKYTQAVRWLLLYFLIDSRGRTDLTEME